MEERIAKLEQEMREHKHNGIIGRQIQLGDVLDFVPTSDTAPTYTPRKLVEQFKIYSNSTTYRFYVYDVTNRVWRYTTLT